MSLKIDSQLADSLTLRIAAGLDRIDIIFGFSLSDLSWTTAITDSLPRQTAESLESICGEKGLGDFLFGEISKKIDCDPNYRIQDPTKLTDLSEYEDRVKASHTLVEDLGNLPYSYRCAMALPKSFSTYYFEYAERFELASGIFIMTGAKLKDDFPLTTGHATLDNRLVTQSGKTKLESPSDDTLYLVQYLSGYMGRQKEAPLLSDFKTTVRQFVGALLASKIASESSWSKQVSESYYVVHKKNADGFELSGVEKISPDLANLLEYMDVIRVPARLVDEKSRLLLRRLNSVKSVFAKSDHGKRLSVASLWYLRSYLSRDTLDGLLEATIAIEALLGGGSAERTKLSDLLGNRCAFLIGSSITERQEILSKFTEIYALRSKIVHEGHHRFSSGEKGLLSYAREMCRKAMFREMQLSS